MNFDLTRQYLTSLRLYQFARDLIKLIDKNDKLIAVCTRMCVWGGGRGVGVRRGGGGGCVQRCNSCVVKFKMSAAVVCLIIDTHRGRRQKCSNFLANYKKFCKLIFKQS